MENQAVDWKSKWDSAPVPHVAAADLDIVSFREFRKKALVRGRLSKEDLDITDEQLLETLKLTTDGKYLKRAAILTFHEDPEKWVTGAYVKIGYFKSDDDLVFQDEIHGSLITMPDKTVDMLFDKYFKGIISYRGLQRIETYPVDRDSMRETVLNAIVHKDYATGIPIQIRVYDDKTTIFNAGALPLNWTVQDLLTFHTSMPHNPDLANAFFKSGMTEAWGRGIEKIINSNVNAGKPKPRFEIIGNGLRVTFYSDAVIGEDIGINIGININETQKKIVDLMTQNSLITAEEIAKSIGIAPRNVEANISKLKKFNLVDRYGSRKSGRWIVNPY